MVETALHLLIAAVIAGGVGLVLVRTPQRWLGDRDDAAAVAGSPLLRPWALIATGMLIAATAAVFNPVTLVEATWTALAPGGERTLAPTLPSTLDSVLMAAVLGVVAGASPFLVVTDLVVRRLPDRLVYPLMAIVTTACLIGLFAGTATAWWFGLTWAMAGLLLFGALHLLGRVLDRATMGLGDVKLAFVVGGVAGLVSPWAPALVLVLTMAIAGIWALVAGLRAGTMRATTIAFGPAMLSGLWLGSVSAPFVL